MYKTISDEVVNMVIADVCKVYGIEGYRFTDEEVELVKRYLNRIFDDKQLYEIIISKMF